MTENEIITASIKSVRFHKEERKVQGAQYGTYESHYIASLNEYPKGNVIIDELAVQCHPDWGKKTDNRADILSVELKGQKLKLRVTDVCLDNHFEAAYICIVQ